MEDEFPIVAVLTENNVLPSTPDDDDLDNLTQVFQDAQHAVDWFFDHNSSLGVVLALGYSCKVVRALLTASANATLHRPDERFSIAAREGWEKAMEALFRSGFVDINGHVVLEDDTQLTAAIYVRSVIGVRALLRFGADPNLRDLTGSPPLYSAGLYPCLPILNALLDAGADPNAGNEREFPDHEACDILTRGRTALHAAASKSDSEFIQVLIQAGADVNRSDKRGTKPLHVAAKDRNFRAVNALLAADADPMARNTDGATPMMLISQKFSEKPENLQFEGAIATALVAAGARQWEHVPFSCPNLQCALSVVWKDAPDELPQLFKRLEPHWQGVIRATLLPMHRYGLPKELRAMILFMMAGDISDIELIGEWEVENPEALSVVTKRRLEAFANAP